VKCTIFPLLVLVSLCLLFVIAVPAEGVTTQVRVVLYASDGFTILNETTVDYRWMEANLPVMGDGTTQYYHQGPVFIDDPDEATEEALRWNPEEDTNVESKGMGAVKGTRVKDLCDLVGGMEPDEEVKIVSSDGWNMRFAYTNVYEYSGREGPMILAWYNGAEGPSTWERQGVGYVPDYQSGMRLVWLADTSTNPQGIHAFGNYDWHEAAEPEYWYYYQSGGEEYPTTTGLSGKYISEIHILSSRDPVGSIEVSSNPAGVRVYLDDMDTGMDTPCTIGELSEGFYSILVRKPGYLTPEEQDIEVIPGKRTSVSFDLILATQDGGYSGTDSGGEGITPVSDLAILEGGLLTAAEYLHLNGTFSAYPSNTSPFIIKGGEEREITFAGLPTDPAFALLRLYLFLDKSTADPGIDAEPQVVLDSDQGDLAPARTWAEQGEGDQLYAMTVVFSPPVEENGTYTIRSLNHVSWNSTVAGALLLAGYEEPGEIETGVWMCEGADIIGGILEESPMTLAEFSGPFPDSELLNATILVATTPGFEADTMSFFVNGVSTPGFLVSGEFPVAVHTIPLPDISGSLVRFHADAGDSVVTNRVAILTMEIPLQEETPGSVPSGVPTTPTVSTPIVILPPPGETTAMTPVPSGTEQRSGFDPIGNFLCWLHNFVQWFQGKPPEPCYQRNGPAVPVSETLPPTLEVRGTQDDTFIVSINTTPSGATVFLDGQQYGMHTPCDITVSSEGDHTIRIEQEGYQPSERKVTGPAAIEIHLLPVLPTPPMTITSAPAPAPSHHGGLYISSYPEQAEIKIDGIVVGTRSPLLIVPLKEGFHTISVGILTSGNVYSAQETIRTWVFPDAIIPVEFNLMDTTILGSVTIGGETRSGEQFTVNGYYPVKRIPEQVELAEHPSFITLTDDGGYYSFTIPQSSRDSREFSVPTRTPLVCNLSVESDPAGAELFIDGIRTGLRTPAVVPNVSEGYHRISLASGGRLPVTERIYIAESQCLIGGYAVRYSLPWYASGGIDLTSEPPGAAVSIRGLKTGEVTPCSLDGIPIGVWEVMLTLDKSKRYLDVTVEPDQTRKYSVVFD
jgi:hypothetical protein